MQRQTLSKSVNAMARKVVYCPYCSAINGTVKKAGALKIIHDKFRAKKTAEEMEKWKKTFTKAVEGQKELAMYLNKAAHEELNPLKVLDLFRRVSDEASTHHPKGLTQPHILPRTASYWACNRHGVGPKSSSGNTCLCLLSVSDPL
jgi:hypothetical protein